MNFKKIWDEYSIWLTFGFMFLMMWAYTVPWLRKVSDRRSMPYLPRSSRYSASPSLS